LSAAAGEDLLETAPAVFPAEFECLDLPSDWIRQADTAWIAERVEFGERYLVEEDPLIGLPAAARTATLVNPELVWSSDPSQPPAETPTLVELEAVTPEPGEWDAISGRDLGSVTSAAGVLVLGWTSPSQRDNTPPYLSRTVWVAEDGTIDLGTACTHTVGAALDGLAAATGRDSTIDLIVDWLTVRDTPEEAALLEAETSYISGPSAAEQWNVASPELRSLRPADVPDAVREALDVRAAIVDVKGLDTDQVVAIRTESGVSSAVSPGAQGSAVPLFFQVGVDTTVEVVVVDVNDFSSATVLAMFPVSQLVEAGGVTVIGDATRADVAVLDRVATAEALGMSEAALDRLRADYLSGAAG
jgi:hypothetical protein